MRVWTPLAVALVGSCLLTPLAAAEDPDCYVCAMDQATGFRFENGTWIATNFNSAGAEKFLMRKSRPETHPLDPLPEYHNSVFVSFGQIKCSAGVPTSSAQTLEGIGLKLPSLHAMSHIT
jgi:hypothetical protein